MSGTIGKTNKRYKAVSKTVLHQAYQCSPYTFRQWIKKINRKLGSYSGGLYTPKQVKIIIDHLGEPPLLEDVIYQSKY
ncbi:hypothetical protein ATE84_2305 [Aquimarina sp. MAR_2010_214]|uniref:hypothetical protein n=1 Tax=Aquimarina sp. MAR_2010_214 TaxID=1250026 RepID=UPI000C70A6AD|nr:hypothetical protein [Aquimarina sp. MAR_2010_214]PKV50250.1 hypothetical protein ATE84_2305 [Aquimarina sp. MAR_2010_214]